MNNAASSSQKTSSVGSLKISCCRKGSKILRLLFTKCEYLVKFALPFPAFLGGRGGASLTGEEGQSVETLYI